MNLENKKLQYSIYVAIIFFLIFITGLFINPFLREWLRINGPFFTFYLTLNSGVFYFLYRFIRLDKSVPLGLILYFSITGVLFFYRWIPDFIKIFLRLFQYELQDAFRIFDLYQLFFLIGCIYLYRGIFTLLKKNGIFDNSRKPVSFSLFILFNIIMNFVFTISSSTLKVVFY